MTNQIAIWLGLLQTGAALFDMLLTGGATVVASLRLFDDVIDSLKFWR